MAKKGVGGAGFDEGQLFLYCCWRSTCQRVSLRDAERTVENVPVSQSSGGRSERSQSDKLSPYEPDSRPKPDRLTQIETPLPAS